MDVNQKVKIVSPTSFFKGETGTIVATPDRRLTSSIWYEVRMDHDQQTVWYREQDIAKV